MSDHDAIRLALALGPHGPLHRDPRANLDALERSWPRRQRWEAWRHHRSVAELVAGAARMLDALRATGGAAIFHGDSLYPSSLRRPGAPPVVFCRGDVGVLGGPFRRVAIVGSRASFRADNERAGSLAAHAARSGWVVVSGGALGIDAAAHVGALAAEGKTAVILGSGLDRLYPPRNARLFDEIVAAGGLLLTPFAPGTPPRRGNFPARNALVAGTSAAVVVVAAALRSGALSTAHHAQRLKIPLGACPGTAGCDALLARGAARALRDASELEDLVSGRASAAPLRADTGDHELLGYLTSTPQSVIELAMAAGQSPKQVTTALLELELDGLVVRGVGGRYRAV